VIGRLTPSALFLSICASTMLIVRAQSPVAPISLDQELQQASAATYNLDYDIGVSLARHAVGLAPGESRAHKTLASIIWLDVLFQRGAVTVDHYLGGITKTVNLPKPPPDLDAEFKREVGRAIELAQARTRRDNRDTQALEDLGTAYGLQASYSATVEGSVVSAFSSARGAFNAGETLLERNPRNMPASLLVGSYRYAVATLSLPSRMFAYVAGFSGGKAEGIRLLEAASAPGASTHVEAATALALIYSREGRHAEAVNMLRGLAAEFPRNRLFVLEQGSAAIRAGRAADAEVILTNGLDMLDRDQRRKMPGERALWLYKRGMARLNLNRPAVAAGDFQLALTNEPVDWVKGRIHLAQGKVADLQGHRTEALAEYRTARALARAAEDAPAAADAAHWIDTPFTMKGT
jgi:predicted Zn-dependent protease